MDQTGVDELATMLVALIVAALCVFFYFVPIPDPTLEEIQAEIAFQEKKRRAEENMFRVEPIGPHGTIPREQLGWFAAKRRALQEWCDAADAPAADPAPTTTHVASTPVAVMVPTKNEDFAATLAFFTEGPTLSFKVLEIFPADAPREALLSGHGCRIKLVPPSTIGGKFGSPGVVVYSKSASDGGQSLTAPNGTVCTLLPAIETRGGGTSSSVEHMHDGCGFVVLPTKSEHLKTMIEFFTDGPVFYFTVLETPSPAAAHEVLLFGHSCRIKLAPPSAVGGTTTPSAVRLEAYVDSASVAAAVFSASSGSGVLTAPNGTVCTTRPAVRPVAKPMVVMPNAEHTSSGGSFGVGRAGMTYRELMPSRAGGAVVASHIRVATNGPVPDYVHYHRVQFQMIYCVRGWARLVYEDGGPPSIMKAGDCVVQPPTIRHRVLESGDGLEVVEVSCPAEHETIADPDMQLPTESRRTDRVWHGQRFSWHRSVPHHRRAAVGKGWRSQDLGTAAATGGVGEAIAYTAEASGARHSITSIEPAIVLIYVVSGAVDVEHPHGGKGSRADKYTSVSLVQGDSLSLPPASGGAESESAVWLTSTMESTELLVVTLPVARIE